MPPGRRERKKLETRQRIVDGAVALFATQGYDATTMDDIAESADVSRATAFNFFPRKADLVLAWFAERRAEVAERLAEIDPLTADTATQLGMALRAIAHVFDQDPSTGRAMVRAWLQAGGALLTPESETSRIFADTIREGQRRGDVSTGIDADRAGRVVFDAYLGVLYRWVDGDETQAGIQEDLLGVLGILLTGIVPAAPAETATVSQTHGHVR
jgi:AcrR family transcriptional regulator